MNIIILALIIVGCVGLHFFLKSSGQRREKLLLHALNGDIEAHHLNSGGTPKEYVIIYNDNKGTKSFEVFATNATEAEYLFCKGTGKTHFKIKSTYRL